ncbi:haloacid dehalogenase [Sphingomonas oleivorans]|uniref:Haloacid dehalogenase n=1 Tax=Sphingomonas oleivorans TaxID=1735121 RepID=A0A2T5G0Y1_9SPHN|nr:HAD-IA family hydrolase [Sphingomonas oleivorans]PTQ12816.1 haloacid dehalogenase [Sphingomonas oleivorans]
MSNRLAIFDCDGTLVDSQHNICTAMQQGFVAAGLTPPSREATLNIVGLSLVEAMQALLPDADPDLHVALGDHYKRAFTDLRAGGLVHEPLFEGMADALDALDRAGWLLGVATGKSDRGLGLCLDHHGLKQRFATLQTADRHPSKPHPSMIHQAMADAGADPQSTVMIGDTSYDIAMAKAAGVTAIGVAWGYHRPAELYAEGADLVADHPSQLISMLEGLS